MSDYSRPGHRCRTNVPCSGNVSLGLCSQKSNDKRKRTESNNVAVVATNPIQLDLSNLHDTQEDEPQPRKSPRLHQTSSPQGTLQFASPKSENLKTSYLRPASAKIARTRRFAVKMTPGAVRPHSSAWTPLMSGDSRKPSIKRPGTAPHIKVTEAFQSWSETELLEGIEKASLYEPNSPTLQLNTDVSYMSLLESVTPLDAPPDAPPDESHDETVDEHEQPLKDPIKSMMEMSVVNEEDYNTDLEEEFPASPVKHYDSTGRTVYLEQCQHEGVDPISFVLRNLNEPSLRLRHRYMAPRDVKPLAQALASNSWIEDLDLNDNHLTEEGAVAIAVMMKNNNYIHKLNLSENLIGHRGSAAMSYMLESNYTLKRLCLSGNHLTDRDAALLANGLRSNGTLTELDLSYNQLGEAAGVNLAPALASNDGLVYLDLKWNSIRGKGIVALANALKINCALEVLDLSHNAVALPGSVAFMRALKVNTRLRILNLSHNHVNTQATQKLSLGLKKNTKLEVLMLNGNPIGDEGINALLKALSLNTSIKLLNIKHYSLKKSIHQNLTEVQEVKDICIICRDARHTHLSSKDSNITVSILNELIDKNQTQVIDKCYLQDEQRTGFISATQFSKALQDAGIAAKQADLETVLEILHLQNSQRIYYRHILNGLSALC